MMVNLPDINRDKKLNMETKIVGVVSPPTQFAGPDITFSVKIFKQDPTEFSEYLICEIDAATPEGIAHQIANAIREARDIGFEQGRRYVREALGLKE
jgi:hypothetical protein